MTEASNAGRGRWMNVALMGGVVLLCSTGGEIAVRLAGHRPWAPLPLQYEVTPAGRLFAPDPQLGYANLPGDFEVQMSWDHRFRVRVDERGRRRSHAPADGLPVRPEIWILGGSYTHGWLVNDQESYPWLLQARLPGYEVVNFGVPGYGTLQSLLQFEKALTQHDPPAVAVLAYASFHDIRNTVVRRLRKARLMREADEIQLPSGSLEADGSLRVSMVPVDYSPWPLMRISALAHLLEETWNRLEVRMTPSHEITRAVIARLQAECRRRGILLVIAGLTDHPETMEMLEYWRQNEVAAADISFDAAANPEFRFIPYDNHPSPSGHAHYAERLRLLLAEHGVQ